MVCWVGGHQATTVGAPAAVYSVNYGGTIQSEGPSYNGTHSAANVLQDDGDGAANIWLTPPGVPSWFILDLGSVKRVSSFTLRNTLYAHVHEP